MGLIFEIILEFRVTRWIVLGGLALWVILSGGLATAGGWGTLGFCVVLLGVFELFERIGRRKAE